MAIRVVHQPVGAVGLAAFAAGRGKYARRKEEERAALRKEFRGMAFTQGMANQKYGRDLFLTGQRQQHQLGLAQDRRKFTVSEREAQQEFGITRDAGLRQGRIDDAIAGEDRAADRLAKQDEDEIERMKESLSKMIASGQWEPEQIEEMKERIAMREAGIKNAGRPRSAREIRNERAQKAAEAAEQAREAEDRRIAAEDRAAAQAKDQYDREQKKAEFALKQATAMAAVQKNRADAILAARQDNAAAEGKTQTPEQKTAQAAAIHQINKLYNDLEESLSPGSRTTTLSPGSNQRQGQPVGGSADAGQQGGGQRVRYDPKTRTMSAPPPAKEQPGPSAEAVGTPKTGYFGGGIGPSPGSEPAPQNINPGSEPAPPRRPQRGMMGRQGSTIVRSLPPGGTATSVDLVQMPHESDEEFAERWREQGWHVEVTKPEQPPAAVQKGTDGNARRRPVTRASLQAERDALRREIRRQF